MYKNKLVGILIIVLVVLSVNTVLYITHAYSDDDQKITVVMDDNYPPFSFRDSNGVLQGITIDQWRLFEKKTGIRVEITGMEWSKAFQSMKDGMYDVIDTISYNKEREAYLDYTKPYATIDVPIFFHKNISGITDVESLKGFTVAAKKSDNAIRELEKRGISNIVVYDTAEAVVKAAKDQEIVIFVMGKPPSMYYMYKMGIQQNFNYASSLYTSQFYRAVKEGDKKLLNTLNEGFAKITKQEYDEIDKKWYGNTYIDLYNSKLFRKVLIIVSAIILIVFILILWNRTLHLKVRQKTRELSKTIDKLQISEARIRALLEAIPDIFFLLDQEGRILDYHAMQENMLYIDSENFINKKLSDIFPIELAEKFQLAIDNSINSDRMQTCEYHLDIKDERYHYEARLAACGKDRVVGIVRDITERKKTEEKLMEISIHDTLTGLYNRYYFEKEIARLQKSKMKTLCIAMFDLDGLKLINDTMGHAMGDQYLIAATQIITKSFPMEAMVARIGGDEFCAVIIDKTEEDISKYSKYFVAETDKYNSSNHVIQISISFGYAFAKDYIDISEIMREADNNMYRVKLHRRQSMKSEIVQTMKNMLEARDFITEGHANRMEELAVMLAHKIGIPEKDISDIRLLAQFHDIGKVGIPDYILFKPSKLTPEEFEIMKRHTEIGHRIAEASVDLLPIADFILKHHEYWNGKGYPFGIKGEEIPIECRILSIVDAYDAMTNDRPYRKAMSKPEALDELKKCSGTQFDPVLTDVFIKMIETRQNN
ncbi:MAG: HD domain-containing phosphohydrolase [Bacillota bacterium]